MALAVKASEPERRVRMSSSLDTGALNQFRPLGSYPGITQYDFEGESNYNSMQLALIKRYSHGFQISSMLQAYSSLPFNITSGVTTVQGTAGRPLVNGQFIPRNAGAGSDFLKGDSSLNDDDGSIGPTGNDRLFGGLIVIHISEARVS